jgi:heterodisulfide reductase subunit B
MKLGYYPGCSLNGTAKEFNSSLMEVFSALDIDLEELNDWSCCGATSAHVTSHILSVALPARNLMIAKKQGFEELLAPCAACYSRLVSSQRELKLDEKMRMKVEDLLEEKVTNGLHILNLIQMFEKIGLDKLKENKKVDISKIKAACYYGCLLVRPVDIALPDDMESPDSMEAIIKAIGGKTVDWNFKTECCGAAHSIAHTDIVEKLCKGIIDNAEKHGADVIIVACPMCHSNLDMRQLNIMKHFEGHKPIPILYLSQLIGLVLGIDEKKLGLGVHYINTRPLLDKIKGVDLPPEAKKAPPAPPVTSEKIKKGVEA